MPINYYILLSVALFCIGIVGVLTRRNAIIIFMCIELMLNAVNLLLVAFSKMHYAAAVAGKPNAGIDGQLFVFFIMVVAAAEVKGKIATLETGDIGLIRNLGKALFTDYVVPFEISSVLFLSAMVGAVVISKK